MTTLDLPLLTRPAHTPTRLDTSLQIGRLQTAPLIQVSGLCKPLQMGGKTVHGLAGVDLQIEPRTFAAVIGPSGSGKSTLLYLLGGLDRPDAGTIEVAGNWLHRLDQNGLVEYRRRKVGFIFQSFNLIASLSALENVAFVLRFAGVPRRQRQARALALLRQVGLEQRAHHKPTEMSGSSA